MNDLPHNCELWAEPISLLAAGCLAPEDERDVRRHFETCPDCRERFGQLTQLCGALAEAQLPVNVAENAIVERVMSAVASEESGRPGVRTQEEMIQPSPSTRSLDRWRWIMRSPISRFAAAAIFVLAITGFAMLFQGGGGAAFGFDDFIAPILEAKSCKCKMIVEMKGPPARTITSEVMMLDGARMRKEIEMSGKLQGVMITDLSQGKKLVLVPALKSATLLTLAKKREDKNAEDADAFAYLRAFQLAAQEKPGIESEPLGEKEIDGRKVVGFRIATPSGVLSLWGDPETGQPVRVEMTMGIEGSTKTTLSDFVFNVDMDESLFSLEPPAGYTVRSQKSDRTPKEEKDLIEMFREYSELCDGSFPDSLDLIKTKSIVFKKADTQIKIQSLWESLRLKGKPNEEQRHKLEELMSKAYEGRLNEEQIRKTGEQIGALMQEFVQTQGQKAAEVGEAEAQEAKELRKAQFRELQQQVQRGLDFANNLPPSADARYVGKGVSFGAADTPIFWYRPKDSKNYRVIYADLSVRDSDTPPNVTSGQSEPAPSSPKQ